MSKLLLQNPKLGSTVFAALSKQISTVVGLRQPGERFTITKQGLLATYNDGGLRLVDPNSVKFNGLLKPPSHLVRFASSVDGVVDQGFALRAEPGELIHRATRDLWGFEQDDDGKIVLCRLFHPSGTPLKI